MSIDSDFRYHMSAEPGLTIRTVDDSHPLPGNVDPLSAETFRKHYSHLYKNEDNDSPPECRASMMTRIAPVLYELPQGSLALDMGAGRQIFEREMTDVFGEADAGIITVDIAELSVEQLLASEAGLVTHIETPANDVPLVDGSVNLAWSILALDFFQPREEAVAELRRVMKPGAPLFLALHDPNSIFPSDLDHQIGVSNRKVYRRGRRTNPKTILENEVLRQKAVMRDSGVLFQTPDQIADFFDARGFRTEQVGLAGRRFPRDTWWEARLAKA